MNKSTEGVQVEKRLALVKSTVAASLNSILRQVDGSDFGVSSELRMKHNVKSCREALKILLEPAPPPPPKKRKSKDDVFLDFNDLTGEK